jgi:hypothetical protein
MRIPNMIITVLYLGTLFTSCEKKASTLKEGLIAYYPFDGNAKDASGNGNDGIVH